MEKFGHRKSFGQRNRTAERGHRLSFDDTEKLFRDIPLSQIGFATCLIILGGCQNHSGNFLELSEIKPKMFRSCRNRFRCFSQMKITKLELFQNALKIIMVGTGNVLSPHKYFQFERTLKNVVVNSESAFWDILWKATFWGFAQKI